MQRPDAMFYPMKPNPYRRRFKTDAEKLSIEIRQKLGLNPKVACPARRVADLYKVSVTSVQDLIGLIGNELSDVSRKFPDQLTINQQLGWLLRPDTKFSAMVAIVGEFKMILYNSNHSLARQESDIMHELAHIICGHPGDCLQLNADIALRQYNESHEAEAIWLGATLQIPDEGIFSLVRAGLSNETIAEVYGASLKMVAFRRQSLGIDIRISRLK